ncbi:heparinase II/III family protein [Salinarimonas rosea]|uniref:heparinase II/III family protein n=1 Tax=Salinarimonas rosea TaxID=552063 RepID=UPI0004108FCF|nr:heparinase II/III family protein [Salinarimonas rosea]
MTDAPDRWRLTGLALREAGRALRAETASLFGLGGLRARTPRRLVIVPPDMRTCDATIADDIYAGYFVFGGRTLATGGRSPFALEPPSEGWADILHGFSWLRHLRAADTALARANARALVDEYLRESHGPALRKPSVAARRAISFLSQSPLIVEGADHAFYQRFLRGLARDLSICARAARAAPRPIVRLQAAIALAYAGLCCEGCETLGRGATKVLARELDRQVLADGGHVGRNPRTVLDLLLDLLPLKQVYLARGVDPPEALIRAIDRMPPMLRLLRHGDGTLSHFNGTGSTPVDHLTTLLFYDEGRASPLQRGLISGYERLQAGGLVLVADVGAPPPPFVAHEAAAGCLSFELTSGEARLVVNLGAPRERADPLARAARDTAAHATITLDRASCGRFTSDARGLARLPAAFLERRFGTLLVDGPGEVQVKRPEPLVLEARHDGYAAAFGLVHERRLALSGAGDGLSGEDRLVPVAAGAAGAPAALRFHLHPSVRARLTQGGRVVLLGLSNGETWQFVLETDAAGAATAKTGRLEARLDESLYLSATDGARKSCQIVVAFDTAAVGALAWRFERLTRA